jgi:hypothetical protein
MQTSGENQKAMDWDILWFNRRGIQINDGISLLSQSLGFNSKYTGNNNKKPRQIRLHEHEKCSSKDNICRVKRQTTEWEKVFPNHVLYKELIFRIYRELKLNKKISNFIQKWAEDWVNISSTKKYKWSRNTWKDVQQKLKLQQDITSHSLR